MKKITKKEIQQEIYKAYKDIILEQVSNMSDRIEKIKKLAELGKKIEGMISNSLVHLNGFMNLGIKTEDSFEFRRAVAEVNRIQKLTADYGTVITRAHEIAEGHSENETPEQNSLIEGRMKDLAIAIEDATKEVGEDPKKIAQILKKEYSDIALKYLEKYAANWLTNPMYKGKYESKNFGFILKNIYDNSIKTVDISAKDINEATSKINEPAYQIENIQELDLPPKIKGDDSAIVMDPNKHELKDEAAQKRVFKPGEKQEAIDAIDQIIHRGDRVVDKIYNPKTGKYEWAKDESYRIQKIFDNYLIIKDFKSNKLFKINPKNVKRIGITHKRW